MVIAGPTSAGKTDVALLLAEKFSSVIISADARQCYKYLDIGTGKVSEEDQKRIPHFNISVLYPDEPDTAADFAKRCSSWESKLKNDVELIIYAGGSTLHLESLLFPFDPLPQADSANIQKLEEQAEQSGIESLYNRLKQVDPQYIKKMNGMNRQRIIRALDVWMQTGKPFSSFHQQKPTRPAVDHIFVLAPERELLYRRINARVDQMLDNGLIEEVQSILNKGYSPDLQSLQTVGYREVIAYLSGDMNYPEMVDKIKTQTRRYAKRQLTWFRRWEHARWIDSGISTKEILSEILSHIEPEIHNRTTHG